MRKVRYWHPQNGWQDSQDGALLRLDAAVESRLVGQGDNKMFQLKEGRWERLPEGAQLSAEQRGLVWQIWPEVLADMELIAFRGLRVVDHALLQGPLSGITLYDRSGREITQPTAAGESFLLTPEGAKQFVTRLKEIGGSVARVEHWLPEAEEELRRLKALVDQTQHLVSEDIAILEAAERGDLTKQLEFDNRGPRLRELLEEARASKKRLEDDLAVMERTSTATRARGMEMASQATGELERAEALWAARQRAERMMASHVSKQRSRSNKKIIYPEIAVDLLMRDLAEMLKSRGLKPILQAGELHLSVDGQNLVLGQNISISEPSAVTASSWITTKEWPS